MKLEYGNIADWIAIARQSIAEKQPTFELKGDTFTINDVQDLFLKKVGYEYVKRKPCIDHRELDEMIDLSKEFGFEVVQLKLGEGDYQSERYDTQTINIERKDNDFIPSLFHDKHIYEQLNAMRKNPNVKASYLICTKSWQQIKRDMESRHKPLPRNLLISYVGELALMGYPPIFVDDYRDYMDLVEYLFDAYYKNVNRAKRINNAISIKEKNIIKFPGVSDKLAERLLEKFGSIKGVCNATPEQLLEVKGIGEKTAQEIYKLVN
ncbi:helix-hairpin-helix domain-containing protein [Sulfuricurvum sp.]|uniref:helix-hairpin-helix domain-containing protein n=1 Tax=Sulfuricurvum sp. TaxID=2025608 RepID=UPI00356AEBB7